MKKRFNPIKDKSAQIIEYLMSSPDIPQDDALQFRLRLCIEEAVENVVNYAYEGGIGWMEAEINHDYVADVPMLTVTLMDAGTPFNPLEKQDPDINATLEERSIGGLGIFICKQMMDNLTYKYEDGCNILKMQKILK